MVQDRAIQAVRVPLVSLVIRSVHAPFVPAASLSSKEIDRVQFRGVEDLAVPGRLRPAAGRARRADRRPAGDRRRDQRPPRGGRPARERRLPRRPRGAGQGRRAASATCRSCCAPPRSARRRTPTRSRPARSSRSTSTTTRATPRPSCSARGRSPSTTDLTVYSPESALGKAILGARRGPDRHLHGAQRRRHQGHRRQVRPVRRLTPAGSRPASAGVSAGRAATPGSPLPRSALDQRRRSGPARGSPPTARPRPRRSCSRGFCRGCDDVDDVGPLLGDLG